jgi:hypothetical protein
MDERRGPGFACYKPFFVTVRGRRFGFEYSRVGMARPGMREVPYLDRYIVYLGGLCVRLHKFWRGDDDRAPHDHPWNFWTFPLTSYKETVEECLFGSAGAHAPQNACVDYFKPSIYRRENFVKAWRLHKRPAKYRHIVLGRADGSTRPFWTFVITGKVVNKWGFWPEPDRFVPWRDWT